MARLIPPVFVFRCHCSCVFIVSRRFSFDLQLVALLFCFVIRYVVLFFAFFFIFFLRQR